MEWEMGHIARLAAVIGCLVFGTSVLAQQVIVIGNDMGGIVGSRADEIERINASGARVEIRGDVCISSCTMYLGVGDVCVSPDTDFGFHGPSFFGADLPEREFEYWSRVIANHYNAPLRDWFMREARYRNFRPYTLSGEELIRIGYTSC
jgi:hypothetical protein